MRVAIRVDMSVTMGLGHALRCKALAFALSQAGASVRFVSRPIDLDSEHVLGSTHELHLLEQISFPYEPSGEALPRHASWAGVSWERDAAETVELLRHWDPDWIVVDHYSFDSRWHDAVRQMTGCRIAVIDDLADRQLSADILVDHNWSQNHRLKYGAYAADAVMLAGPRYALLGPDYSTTARYAFSNDVRSIGIFMGGTDAVAMSETVLDACREKLGFRGSIEVATTSFNQNLDRLRARCAAWPRTHVVVDQPSLASFFARHDLQIGAGGGATWERCCMGAPTIAVICAENQIHVVRPLHTLGVLVGVEKENSSSSKLAMTIRELMNDARKRRELAASARNLVDGLGAIRVAKEILSKC